MMHATSILLVGLLLCTSFSHAESSDVVKKHVRSNNNININIDDKSLVTPRKTRRLEHEIIAQDDSNVHGKIGLSHLDDCTCGEYEYGKTVGTIIWNHSTIKLYRDAARAISAAKRGKRLSYKLTDETLEEYTLVETTLARTSFACACVIYEIKGTVFKGQYDGSDHVVFLRCCNEATHCLVYHEQPTCPFDTTTTTPGPTTTVDGTTTTSYTSTTFTSTTTGAPVGGAISGLEGICLDKYNPPEQTQEVCDQASWCGNYDLGGGEDPVFCGENELCHRRECNDVPVMTHTHSCGLVTAFGKLVEDSGYMICADDLDCSDDKITCPPGLECFRECRPFL